jgi:SSS family solute:Na+ symporter
MDEIIVPLHVVDWLIILGYVAFMITIAFYASRRQKNFDDYFMAGRTLTAPLLVGTLVSTFYGLDTLFGTSEVGFYEGISGFFAFSLPFTFLYLVMAFVAPKFKRAFPEGTTMQEIAFRKYGKPAGIITSVASYVYSTNAMEMMGIGFLLHLIAGIPFAWGTLVGAVIVVLYTWMGGLWAVTLTDFVQFVAMMLTVGIGLIIGWNAIGGFDRVFAGLVEWTGSVEGAGQYFSVGAGQLTPWVLLAYSVTGLAVLVLAEPAMFQRMFASASPGEIKKAFLVGVPMWLSFDWAVVFLGIMGASAIGLGVIPEVAANEALFAVVGQYLPVGLLGVFVAGVLAAAMSTADSYFLVAGGVVGYDIYKGVINPEASDRNVETVTKYAMLASAVVAILLAFTFDRIMQVWVFQATIIITTAVIPVYFGTFSKKPQKKIAGTLATAFGFSASIIWYIWFLNSGTWDDELSVSIVRVLIIYLVANSLGKNTVSEKAAN